MCSLRFAIGAKISRQFFIQSEIKTKKNRNSFARVFPRNYLHSWLVHSRLSMSCDWLEWFLCFDLTTPNWKAQCQTDNWQLLINNWEKKASKYFFLKLLFDFRKRWKQKTDLSKFETTLSYHCETGDGYFQSPSSINKRFSIILLYAQIFLLMPR